MPFLFPKRYEIFKLNIRRCLLSHAEVIIELSHLKNSHLGAKDILITRQFLQERQAHCSLTHTLCWTRFFRSCGVPWGPTPNLT